MKNLIAIALLLLVGIPLALSAKRTTPQPVSPIVHNKVEYSADGDGRTGYVVATDISSGKELWKARIFRVHVKPFLEEDVQWIFINDLKLIDNALSIRDEKSRCYRLELTARRVRRVPCP